MHFLRLGIAGMRGEVGSGLTPLLAINYAAALGTWIDGGSVVVGTDTRNSSPMFYSAVVSALLGCGCQVYDAGICPAPLLHFLVPHLHADAGILIGAGHHPANWNALVALGGNGAYLNAIQVQELLDIYHSGEYRYCEGDRLGRVSPIPDTAADSYLDQLLAPIEVSSIVEAGYTVIADFCNGSGSIMAAKLASRLGLNLISLNDTLSGILPHDPEPRPRSSTQVQSIMAPLHAAIGFVFNSDMSRIAVVTDDGETLSEEYSFPLAAQHILSRLPSGQTVVTNPCSTRTLDDVAARYGAEVIKTKVGQAFIVDAMLENHAVLGGDGSGSVVMANGVGGYDSFLVMVLLLEAMAVHKTRVSELVAALPRYHLQKRKFTCPAANAYKLLRHLKTAFPDARITEEDGTRFDWRDGWVHLRCSATEPVIRMIVEWRTREEAEDRAMQVQGILERLVSA